MSTAIPLRNAARRFGPRPALIEGDRRWSFAELEREVELLARGLAERLPPGSRVGLLMPNRADYVLLQLALERAALVRVPLNARYTAFEVANVVADCGAAALLYDAATADRLGELDASGLWCVELGGSDWAALRRRGAEAPAPPEPGFDDLCSINYTSGSSGQPKGVMLSHRKWLSVYKNMLVDRDIRGSDRIAHVGPLTHASGTYVLPFLVRGAANVVIEGGRIEKLIPAIDALEITGFTCVPSALTRIVNHPDLERASLASLRWIGYGAEAIQTNTLEKALARFGPVLTQNYGLTEAMMTCSRLTPEEHRLEPGGLRLGTIGRPYSFVEIELRDPAGTPVPEGEVGEITIRAEHVMEGYWRRPEETAKVLREGWLWSGDLARRDSDGFIYLMGRSKEMLISGGFNIYPQEVETCLSACPGVLEAAVVGVPDAELGEIGVAFVTAAPGGALTAEGCRDYCRPRLGIKTPKRWHILEVLPKTPNGKIDKGALRRLHPAGA
jgi:acyl-CoA synthetase (AMP-forming)/AMP-acid ligase II